MVHSLPFMKPLENIQIKVEPVMALTLAPNLNREDDIPNEDSQDVQLDSSNLLSVNRYPGVDRVEDQSRITYGLRAGIYKNSGSELRSFIGQSYRLQKDDNRFPEGSGLSNRSSDVVGELAWRAHDRYTANYRYQLDSRHLTSERHEVDFNTDFGRFDLGGSIFSPRVWGVLRLSIAESN